MDDKYSELEKYFDGRYVLKDACSNRHEKLDANVNDIKITQERMSTKMEFSSKIELAILLAGVTAAVTAVMNLILK